MPTYHRATWRRLLTGLLAVAALVVAAIAVLVFARVGALHGDQYHLYVLTNQARGLIPGSEVWLAGQKIGLVSDISFRPVSADTAHRLRLTLDLLSEYQPQIRADSRADIRSGGSLIGAPVVYIGTGTAHASILQEGDTLPSASQIDVEGLTSQVAIAGRDLKPIITNLAAIGTDVRRAKEQMTGTTPEAGMTSLDMLQRRAAKLSQALDGEGTLGLARSDSGLLVRARRAAARADSVLALLRSPETSLGRFRRDSTLFRTMADTRDELAIVSTRMARAQGSAGRFLADSAIVRQLQLLQHELSATMADVKRNPGRYIVF